MSLSTTTDPTGWAGEARLDAAHGLDFVSEHGRRKAWFRGPDGVACLCADPGYAHVVPSASARAGAVLGRWRVLANTPAAQAVEMPDWTVAAAFFVAATVRGISVSGPAAVLSGRSRAGETVVVADPTGTQSVLRVTVDRPGCRVIAADPSVTVVATGRHVVVDVDVTGSAGATHTFTLR
ncbi:MAG TPA: polysaccharide lyase beta-sandwich domain-containing protein [Pseudonocardiaceae bacterium]|nr:polysaccharide lyase beta-sandwich domain-containing protein [Pseudonocardiaceae bacterium]